MTISVQEYGIQNMRFNKIINILISIIILLENHGHFFMKYIRTNQTRFSIFEKKVP